MSQVLAQDGVDSTPNARPRVLITESIPRSNVPTPTPTPLIDGRPVVIISNTSVQRTAPKTYPTVVPVPQNSNQTDEFRSLPYNELIARIDEAKRTMQTKPLRISQTDSDQTTEVVRIAFYDWTNRRVDYAVVMKSLFLDTDYSITSRSEFGQVVRVQTIRGNGVNTPVKLFDVYNRPLLPLIVQYPIEKFGSFNEMAYYVSTHPGIETPEVVSVGRTYVHNVVETARERLREKGIFIQPKIADMAEKLALVEHVDHYRFRNEYHPKIYNDVYTLYALNRGQTYRYAVSSAGAGGMVQMIPATYRMIRSRYYSVGLIPDFVTGMRDHVNASEAMLLYMQMTWNDLISNSTVFDAVSSGIATQEELMAAGYNSNPARLPGYIRRGGESWATLIPRETKIYLQILSSVERFVPFTPRTK
ncbi:MAG: hypothetical protein ACK5NT_01065 [Pyrinomonadaceae bacterium]